MIDTPTGLTYQSNVKKSGSLAGMDSTGAARQLTFQHIVGQRDSVQSRTCSHGT